MKNLLYCIAMLVIGTQLGMSISSYNLKTQTINLSKAQTTFLQVQEIVEQDAFEVGWRKQRMCEKGILNGDLCQEISYKDFKIKYLKLKNPRKV